MLDFLIKWWASGFLINLILVVIGFTIFLLTRKKPNSSRLLEVEELKHANKLLIDENRELLTENVTYKTEQKFLQEKLENQKKELETIQTRFEDSFKNLANEILEDKSKRFTEKNKENISDILKPLQERIKEFESKVENTHKSNLVSNTSLLEQIKNLKELNRQISDDASNLTKALKGDVKMQGNWGEVILERILEESGLRKGIEYQTQVSLQNDEGHRLQPDVIINLPEEKHIIVDSKVSLINYEQLVSAVEPKDKDLSLKALLVSVRAHIDGLSKKHYQNLKGLNSPDFVMIFMPIEGSFSAVFQADNSLYSYALDKQIVITSPSTMLATLRTIAFVWRQENQTRNAQEIARQSGLLYDKFVGFLADLEKIGTNIERSEKSYQDAVKKLSTGRDNLVRKVEKLKELGAKTSKTIPVSFQDESLIEE